MFMLVSALALISAAAQDLSAFTTGPAIADFGPTAPVDGATALPKRATFRVAFDTARQAGDGELNRTIESAARFINLHARAGVPEERIAVAVVVHGGAVRDVVTGETGAASAPLIAALLEKNARIIVCGQSAAALGVAKDDLLPGVELALSAMTAHALLQQHGYTVNPF